MSNLKFDPGMAQQFQAAEALRESQCKARHESSCAIINEELGWTQKTLMKDCDSCYAAGGPVGGEAVRSQLIPLYVSATKKLASIISKEKLEGLKKWMSPEEWNRIASSPEVVWSQKKDESWKKVRPSWEKAESVTRSMLSRGLTNKKVDPETRDIRNVSCFGKTTSGEVVGSPCPSLALSSDSQHHYCNACGCGDTKIAQLEGEGYSKLDYPYLECPRERPGFSNSPAVVFPLPSDSSERSVIFEGRGGGMGDLIMHTWHAAWYKANGVRCAFYEQDKDKVELLRMLGQEVILEGPPPANMIVTGGDANHYRYEVTIDKGRHSRGQVWGSQLPYSPGTMRPSWVVPPDEILAAHNQTSKMREGKKGLVVLFPYAEWNPRRWPLNYWLDLAWALNHEGYAALCLAPSSKAGEIKGFPFFAYGYGWPRLAASMLAADLVIGNDSGPVHLSGTLGVKTIAIMGPTRRVFDHCPSVTCFSNKEMSCTGCHFDAAKGYRAGCDAGCQSLMRLFPEQVAAKAISIMTGGENGPQ